MNAEGTAAVRQVLALCYQLLGEPEPDDDEYEPVAKPEPKSTVKPPKTSRVLDVTRVSPALGGPGQPGLAKIGGMIANLPTRSDLAAVSAEFEAAKAELATSIGTLHRQFEARAHTRKDI